MHTRPSLGMRPVKCHLGNDTHTRSCPARAWLTPIELDGGLEGVKNPFALCPDNWGKLGEPHRCSKSISASHAGSSRVISAAAGSWGISRNGCSP